jgi:hypothetical protein
MNNRFRFDKTKVKQAQHTKHVLNSIKPNRCLEKQKSTKVSTTNVIDVVEQTIEPIVEITPPIEPIIEPMIEMTDIYEPEPEIIQPVKNDMARVRFQNAVKDAIAIKRILKRKLVNGFEVFG